MAGSKQLDPLSGLYLGSLDDGTMHRNSSPLPGTVGSKPMSTIDRLLQQLRYAATGAQLQHFVVALFGQQCFSAGVIVGIGVDILTTLGALLKLVKTLILADLYDVENSHASWWRYLNPLVLAREGAAEIADSLVHDEMRIAAEGRDALIKELGEIFRNPSAFFEGMATSVAEGYKKDGYDFKDDMKADTLKGRFRAGEIFGRLLFDVLGLMTGVAGVARASLKLATKLPRLFKLAQLVEREADVSRVQLPKPNLDYMETGISPGVKGSVANANFAQGSDFSENGFTTFNGKIFTGISPGKDTYSWLAGHPINNVQDLADALKDKLIPLQHIPVDYVIVDGQKVILNTRTSAALTRARVPQAEWYGNDVTGLEVPGAGGKTFDDLALKQTKKADLPPTGSKTGPR